MDIDKSFRLVFNNKVIRIRIFQLIKENNEFIGDQQHLTFKKYYQCNIKWCVKNNHFNLLVYKLLKEVKKRNEFTDDHFHYFLEHNTQLELLKQIFQIYPNLIPTTINEQKTIVEKCSLGNSPLSIPVDGPYIGTNYYYKPRNKQEIIKYLMDELKIKPTKITLNNLCIDGENINLIKSMIENGYYSITEDVDIGLVYCSLKAKDFQFYKLILENNPILKNELQVMTNNVLNQLLVSTCNIEFYKYSFDELLKDEEQIIIKNGTIPKNIGYNYREPILYHLNQTAIIFGNMEIIEYLSNNFHLYPAHHISLCLSNILTTISQCNDGAIKKPLELLKFFTSQNKFDFTESIRPAFKLFIKYNKLDCLIHLKQVYGNQIPIDGDVLDCAVSRFSFSKPFILDWLVGYNAVGTKVDCSFHQFRCILFGLPKTNFQFKPILDLILLSPDRQITESDLSIITTYKSIDINLYEYLCTFITTKNRLNKNSFITV